jgi:hypothetical protein
MLGCVFQPDRAFRETGFRSRRSRRDRHWRKRRLSTNPTMISASRSGRCQVVHGNRVPSVSPKTFEMPFRALAASELGQSKYPQRGENAASPPSGIVAATPDIRFAAVLCPEPHVRFLDIPTESRRSAAFSAVCAERSARKRPLAAVEPRMVKHGPVAFVYLRQRPATSHLTEGLARRYLIAPDINHCTSIVSRYRTILQCVR